ncbi:MAG TPA: hypothetical protein PLB91_15095 [Spirochaetales bacterium]|nr:hypothetical protein [Spirochaetales bacterium]
MSHRPSTPAGLAVAALAALLTGCGASDVVAKYAAISFEAVAEASKDRVAYAEQEAAWSLGSPGGDSIAFSSDFSRGPAEGKGSPIMDAPDIEMAFDLAPLAAAGLDPKRLPEPSGGDTVAYAVEDGTFMIHAELGNEAFPAEAAKSIEATFAAILKTHRSAIGYHEKLDHYGIRLGGGNMFEWAKDLSKNDNDIVFVVDPAPLVAAGLDPTKLSGGWLFAKVESKDRAGKAVFEDKLLRPFDLK